MVEKMLKLNDLRQEKDFKVEKNGTHMFIINI